MKPIVVAGLCLVLAAGSALAQGKRSQTDVPDYSDAPACEAVPDAGESVVCRCETGPTSGSVWGSGPYTADSSICTAARHSGVIGADGGALQLVGAAGEESYEGTEANGVTTSSWGSYGQSFDVRMVSATSASGASSEVCDVIPGDVDFHTCECTDDIGGSVWGSGPYTADSNICTAARHAGYIEAGGGEVVVLRVQGLEEYTGTDFNSETTSSWGSYDSSVIFNWN